MKERFPKWWIWYFAARRLYFIAGIPLALFYSLIGFCFLDDRTIEVYIYAYGGLAAAILPILWRRHAAKKRQVTLQSVVNAVKASGYFNPAEGYEAGSFWQSMYFGIDTRKGTMLYVRIYPGGVMDVIGFDIHNFTRTVVDANKLTVYSKYVTLPCIVMEFFKGSASSIANCMHAMAEKGFNYDVNFPALIQNKRQEWENISKLPVPKIH
ncbi:plasmid IncI1-type surface exclusion protein ExcA [Klebsiella sp. PL-2018]|uniref:plasmid IncI1-type surface exclusion protein ExcA n=1 Tax=Klebsiella TaxID=570 RepID=UPI001C227465|nr:plasmid IncI1-type surface exclusion protein ExcA [Klebsiella sp. PL-2018]QXD01003.1 surface exclusion protein [Klebsiella sp. PL-2018]